MPQLRPEILSDVPDNKPGLPDSELIRQLIQRAERLRDYSWEDFKKIAAAWHTQVTQEKNHQVKTANSAFLNTVESLVSYRLASKWEMGQPSQQWKKINRLKAAQAAINTMFTADALSKYPELLDIFWNKIFTPLAVNSGTSQNEVEAWQTGFMAELAVAKALDKIFRLLKYQNLKVFKGTAKEDVNQAWDLVISTATNQDWPLQVKVQRGGAETFVRWDNTEPPQVSLVYKRNVNELFDPQSGRPTSLLMQELARALPPQFKQLTSVA